MKIKNIRNHHQDEFLIQFLLQELSVHSWSFTGYDSAGYKVTVNNSHDHRWGSNSRFFARSTGFSWGRPKEVVQNTRVFPPQNRCFCVQWTLIFVALAKSMESRKIYEHHQIFFGGSMSNLRCVYYKWSKWRLICVRFFMTSIILLLSSFNLLGRIVGTNHHVTMSKHYMTPCLNGNKASSLVCSYMTQPF